MKIVFWAAALAAVFYITGCEPPTPGTTGTSIGTSTSIGAETGTATHVSVATVPLPAKTPALESTCPAAGKYQAVDLSEPVTQKFLFAARLLGIKTVIRYYEYGLKTPAATISGKEPTVDEIKLIGANGLKLLGVFQHNNSSPSTFTLARGTADATRSVALASEWWQPKGSAIYYGVDFEPNAAQLKNVAIYGEAFAKVARGAGFKVGAYGSGDTLTILKAKGLVDYTWVSQSTGFSGTKAYTASGKWDLLQALPKDCGGINVDFDQTNGADYGQWSAQ